MVILYIIIVILWNLMSVVYDILIKTVELSEV